MGAPDNERRAVRCPRCGAVVPCDAQTIKRTPLRKWVMAMCEAHALTGKCGPDCICQELLDEIDYRRRAHWRRWKFKKQ